MIPAPKKPTRGRPVTGTAKSSTERGKLADAALLDAGGLITRLRLSPQAAIALENLQRINGETQKEIIENMLIKAGKKFQNL